MNVEDFNLSVSLHCKTCYSTTKVEEILDLKSFILGKSVSAAAQLSF